MYQALIDRARQLSLAILSFAQKGHAQTAIILTFAALLCCLPGFFVIPPTDRDESRFMQATRQMIETGDFINIRYRDEARNKKPVGIHWLQAAAVTLTGYGANAPVWTYRLPSLAAALAAVLLTYWALFPLIGRKEALIAALLMSATVMLGIEARIAKTDAVLLATTIAAMGALIRTYIDRAAAARGSVWLIFWLSVSAGILVKGPITPLVVGSSALGLALLRRDGHFLLALRPLSGLILALIVVLPWFIAIAIETQGAFFEGAIGEDLLQKVAAAAEQHWGPPGYYLGTFWVFAWPAAPFMLIAFPWLWSKRRDETVLVLLAWIVPTWLIFEFLTTKLPHYVLPTYPAVMGLIALALCRGGNSITTAWRRFWLAGLWVFPMLVCLAVLVIVYQAERVVLLWGALAMLLAVLAGALAVGVARRELLASVLLAIVAASFLTVCVMQIAAPALRSIWLSQSLAEAIQQQSSCSDPALAVTEYYEPSLVFLTRTDLKHLDAASLADFLAEGGCRLAMIDALSLRRDGALLSRIFQERLAEKGKGGELVASLSGRNVNGFALRRIEVWRLKP